MDQTPIIEPSTFPVYSKSFIYKPQLVIQHSHKFKKHIDDFIHAFSKRIDAELTYQKNLADCSKILEKYIEPTSNKCLSYISSAFKVDNEQRGNQARDLADSLRTEVTAPMQEFNKSFSEIVKKSQKSLKKLNKDFNYFQENYRRCQQSYNENENENKQLIITKHIYRFTSEFSQQKKTKLIGKTMQSIKQKMEYEKNYKNSVSQFNEIIELYRKEVTEILDQIQMEERKQIKTESDAIRKLIVCEVSMFKNVEYDLINISKQMEKMFPENDIQDFLKESEGMSVEDGVKDMSLKNVEFDKSLLTLSLKSVEEDYEPWLLGLKKNVTLRKIIEMRMKQLLPDKQDQMENSSEANHVKVEEQTKPEAQGEQQQKSKPNLNEEEVRQILEEWRNLTPDVFNPPPNPNGVYQKLNSEDCFQSFLQMTEIINKIWIQDYSLNEEYKNRMSSFMRSNHFSRVLAYLFIQQYRIEHYVQMQWENLQKAGELIRNIIIDCDDFKDVFTIKGLLGLIFTFYGTEKEKAKRLLYQLPAIEQCEIWKKEDFWEAAIFESTFEEMANFSLQKGETQAETLLREKNIIFSQLASYCHYMLMLGISSKNVRRIVGRYCRLYEMSEEQNRDLSKMISNTAKQVKESQMLQSVSLSKTNSS